MAAGDYKNDRVALFIDAENLIISAQKQGLPIEIKVLVDRVREEGLLSFARAYADWTQPQVFSYVSVFQDNVIELTQLASYFNKNTADIQIVVDALEMALLESSPFTFVLVAGDRDFVPLVQKLKRYGRRVMGIGIKDTTSQALNVVCDSFLFYDNLLPAARSELAAPAAAVAEQPVKLREQVPQELREAFEVLMRAVLTLERKGQVPMGSNLSQLMKQLDPSFDLSRFTYEKFSDFVTAAVDAGYVIYGQPVGEHFTLHPPPVEQRPVLEKPISFLDVKPSDSSELLRAYRATLATKRVPLIPWVERQQLITQVWERLAHRTFVLDDVVRELEDVAGMRFLNIPSITLFKLAYTMQLGGAFQFLEDMHGRTDHRTAAMTLNNTLEECILRASSAVVKAIRIDSPQLPLQQRPLALLLFDSDKDEYLAMVDEVLQRVGLY